MRLLRMFAMVIVLSAAGGGIASAGPLPVMPPSAMPAAVQPAQLVCGPFRCFRRFGFGWRYGYGRGFGFRPYRRFGNGYGRFGFGNRGFRRFGGRRW